jgi:hypothetical protein
VDIDRLSLTELSRILPIYESALRSIGADFQTSSTEARELFEGSAEGLRLARERMAEGDLEGAKSHLKHMVLLRRVAQARDATYQELCRRIDADLPISLEP